MSLTDSKYDSSLTRKLISTEAFSKIQLGDGQEGKLSQENSVSQNFKG